MGCFTKAALQRSVLVWSLELGRLGWDWDAPRLISQVSEDISTTNSLNVGTAHTLYPFWSFLNFVQLRAQSCPPWISQSCPPWEFPLLHGNVGCRSACAVLHKYNEATRNQASQERYKKIKTISPGGSIDELWNIYELWSIYKLQKHCYVPVLYPCYDLFSNWDRADSWLNTSQGALN